MASKLEEHDLLVCPTRVLLYCEQLRSKDFLK